MTRNVAPGTPVPSGARTVPTICESAIAFASELSCAASGTPKAPNNTASPASTTENLLPDNFHAPFQPFPFIH